MAKLSVSFLECLLCGHKWLPRSLERPRVCPTCKSSRWDVGKRPRKPRSDAGQPRGKRTPKAEATQ